MDLAFATRALRSRNYKLFFAGQGISLVGTWMTRIATSWLIYRLTGSAVLLGIVGFAGQIPAFILGPVAGVWVDRWNRHRTIVVTQVLSMLQSLALAVLALTGIITVWEIIALALFQGLINAFDMPARQSFVIEMDWRRCAKLAEGRSERRLRNELAAALYAQRPPLARKATEPSGNGHHSFAETLDQTAYRAQLQIRGNEALKYAGGE